MAVKPSAELPPRSWTGLKLKSPLDRRRAAERLQTCLWQQRQAATELIGAADIFLISTDPPDALMHLINVSMCWSHLASPAGTGPLAPSCRLTFPSSSWRSLPWRWKVVKSSYILIHSGQSDRAGLKPTDALLRHGVHRWAVVEKKATINQQWRMEWQHVGGGKRPSFFYLLGSNVPAQMEIQALQRVPLFWSHRLLSTSHAVSQLTAPQANCSFTYCSTVRSCHQTSL